MFTERSAALQPQPCEVSRPRRHMFGISASIHVEHGRYMLQEPRRAKQTHTHTYQYDSAPDAAPGSTGIFKQTDFQETLKRGKAREKQNLFPGRLRIVSRAEGKARYCSLSRTQTPRSLKNFSKLYKIFLLVHTTTADDCFSFGYDNWC